MATLPAITTTGGHAALGETAVRQLQASLRGELLLPSNDRYEETRKVWNGMVDKQPALIVRCVGVADVIATVTFARDHNLLVSVRGGGHNIAGTAVCEAGVLLDLFVREVDDLHGRCQFVAAELHAGAEVHHRERPEQLDGYDAIEWCAAQRCAASEALRQEARTRSKQRAAETLTR